MHAVTALAEVHAGHRTVRQQRMHVRYRFSYGKGVGVLGEPRPRH